MSEAEIEDFLLKPGVLPDFVGRRLGLEGETTE